MSESFAEKVERLRPEREMQPDGCSHCGYETSELTNYSVNYGGNVGGHWLCVLCENTLSASRLGAGSLPDETVQDVAAMLNVLIERLPGTGESPTRQDGLGESPAPWHGLAENLAYSVEERLQFALKALDLYSEEEES